VTKRKDLNLSELSMLELFTLEAETQSTLLTQGLLDLEEHQGDVGNLERLMRASHSIKGAARIVGFEAIVRIAHVMEDCFVAAQRENLSFSAEQVNVMFQAVDLIQAITKTPETELEHYLEINVSHLNAIEANLVRVITGEKIPTSESVVTKLPSPAAKSRKKNVAKKAGKADVEAGHRKPSDNKKSRHIADAVVRVDVNRMTRLLGLSSELVVESRWLKPMSESFIQLKKRHGELANILANLRESLLDGRVLSDQDNLHFATAQKKLAECRHILTENLLDLDDYDRRNHNLSSRIYNEVIGTRMRPFVEATQGLQRTVRDLAHSLDKNVTLEITGQETPIDRDVMEKIKSPLNHLVRNAVDHGIETGAERKQSDKSETAIIRMSAHHGGGMLTILVEDDGRGIDIRALRDKVVTKGFASRIMVDKMTNTELTEFLFLPDFSTRNTVTEISGRGVGLDVVRSMIAEMHGTVRIENYEGQGVKFILQLPVTLSVLTVIVVLIADEYYAFPLSRIERLEAVGLDQINTSYNQQTVSLNGMDVRVVSAIQLLGLEAGHVFGDQANIIILSKGNEMYGVVVDSFVGQRELSVQALDKRLGKVQDISAAAIMEDGAPVLIVDVDDLIRSVERMYSGGTAEKVMLQKIEPSPVNRKRILVVDDSLTVREVERKLLMDHGYQVDIAVDGMDGWNAIRRVEYDLLITDVDMPRMDGIELVNLLKQDHGLEKMPVMIVSYKDRHEDRRRGLDAGADYYLSKGSFHDETLIEAVKDLIGEASE